MRLEKAILVFDKDFREMIRNREIMLPMLLLPLSFVILALAVIAPNSVITGIDISQIVEPMLDNLPARVQTTIAILTPGQQATYLLIVYFFAPFFLMLSIITSSAIAADSYAGEKERNTAEALLTTPITDGELLFGKILVSFVPGMGITLISFILYTVLVDLMTYQSFGTLIMPTTPWIVMILTLVPMTSLLGIGVSVIISARVKGVKEAQQIGAVFVVPILIILYSQVSGTLMQGSFIVGGLSLVVGLSSLLVFRIGLKLINRENIITNDR